MLRIGKNPNENEQPDKQDSTAYSTPRTYAPSPSLETQVKPPVESGSMRALTESESLARDGLR